MNDSRWIIPDIDCAAVTRIMLETGLSRPIALMLASRGYSSKKQIENLTNPRWQYVDLSEYGDDFMKAVKRLRRAVDGKEKILVYGDRDVDGVTATVIMVQMLRDLGAEVSWYVTGAEGYGVNQEVLASYIDTVKLIVTVDCGITAVPEARFLRDNKVDLIITDHHELSGELPEAFAVVNPKCGSMQGPDRNLAGCGVSLLVAHALLLSYSRYYNDRIVCAIDKKTHIEACSIEQFRIVADHYSVTDINILRDSPLIITDESSRAKLMQSLNLTTESAERRFAIVSDSPGASASSMAQSWIRSQMYEDPRMRYFLESMLPFAALGCLADMVPLHGLNRCIVHHGLQLFKHSPNPGIAKLNAYFKFNLNSSDQAVTSDVISWKYVPLLNAAGRCGKADRSVNLLLTEKQYSARALMEEISQLNDDRKRIQEVNTAQFEKLLESQYDPLNHKIIFLKANNIPHGVTGIIANRLMRKYHRSTALLIEQDDMIVGTIRARNGFDILAALERCKSMLLKYGGHKKAAGFTLKSDNLTAFKEAFLTLADKQISNTDLIPSYTVDAEITLDDVDDIMLDELRRFEPFGYEWAYPVFYVRNSRLKSIQRFGVTGRHLKMKISSSHRNFDVIGWDMADQIDDLKQQDLWDIIVTLEINRYNGKESLRFNLQDIKPSRISSLVAESAI